MEAYQLLGALATLNADPFIIEDEETAEEVASLVNASGDLHEILDEEEFSTAMEKLDLTEEFHPKRIFAFGGGLLCLDEDWNL